MRRLILLALSCLCLALPDAAGSEPRTWTDTQGRQIEAMLLEVSGDTVTIERAGGRRFTVPASTFSEEDQTYIRQWKRITKSPLEPAQWPDRVQVRVPRAEIVEETSDMNIYRTERFEFRSDARLSRTLIAQFGQVFEATFAAVDALPIGLNISPPEDGYFQTRLFSDPDDYHRAGGIPGSGGLYSPLTREILLPIENLGVERSSLGYSYDKYKGNSALIHEITHQVMHPWLAVLPVWLAEGLAGYMETIPYERGAFQFRQQDLRDYVENRIGTRGDPLPIAPLGPLMDLHYGNWTETFADNQQAVARNYSTVLLLTYYLLHLDGDGNAERLIRYLQALRAGLPDEEADQILRAGRTAEELQKEMIGAFRRLRIRLEAP